MRRHVGGRNTTEDDERTIDDGEHDLAIRMRKVNKKLMFGVEDTNTIMTSDAVKQRILFSNIPFKFYASLFIDITSLIWF